MNTWIARTNLMKHLCQTKNIFTTAQMEDITDVDYRHAKRVFKVFNNKNVGEYHDLYVQSDTILHADVFENFINKFTEIYGLDPAHFLSAPGLAWPACLKKARIRLELLTDVDMLLIKEKGIRGGMCYAIHRYVKTSKKT